MAVITLTTDFGVKDHYLAVLKGVLLSLSPGATLVDISNDVSKFEILEASFILNNAWRDFPEGTIHIVSVNAAGGKDVHQIALKAGGHYFLGPDNGIFSLMLSDDQVEEKVILEVPENHGPSFPAKYILAPAAARISAGTSLSNLGSPLEEFMQKRTLEAFFDQDTITGRVIYLDSYENAIINVNREQFTRIGNNRPFAINLRPKRLNVEFGPSGTSIRTISENYGSVPEGEIMAFFNSNGYLEIGINKGNAGGLLGLRPGEMVRITFE